MMRNNILKLTGKILIIVFSFFLVFNFRIVNLALIALILLVIGVYPQTKVQLRSFYNKNKWFVVTYLLFVIYQLIVTAIGNDIGNRKTGLLLLCMLIPVTLTAVNQLKTILQSFLAALLLIVIIGSVQLTNYYLSSDYFVLTVGGHIDKLLVVARPFLSYMLALGSFVSFYLYQRETRNKWLYIVLPFIYISYILFIGNRIQVLSLLLVLLVYFTCYLKKSLFVKAGGILISVLCFAGIFSISSTLKQRFELDTLKSNDIVNTLAQKEPRIEIWRCAIGVVKEESFDSFFGLKNKPLLEEKMNNCYIEKTVNNPMHQYFLHDKFDTHNQFLEYYVLTGVFGLIGFCSLLFTLFWQVRGYFLSTTVLILLVNFSLVENMLDTQLGTYMFGFSLFLIISFANRKTSQ